MYPPPRPGALTRNSNARSRSPLPSGGLFLHLGPPVSPALGVHPGGRWLLQAVRLQEQVRGGGGVPPRPPQRQEHLQAATTG